MFSEESVILIRQHDAQKRSDDQLDVNRDFELQLLLKYSPNGPVLPET